MIMISLSRCAATLKASLTYIPLEYRLTGVSIKSPTSENSMISAILASISARVIPRMAPLR